MSLYSVSVITSVIIFPPVMFNCFKKAIFKNTAFLNIAKAAQLVHFLYIQHYPNTDIFIHHVGDAKHFNHNF